MVARYGSERNAEPAPGALRRTPGQYEWRAIHVRKQLIAGTVVVALGAGGFVASGAIARPAATYTLSADRSKLKFNKTTIRARAGSVTLRMSNPSNLPHNVGIKGKGVGRTVGKNGTSTTTKRLRK